MNWNWLLFIQIAQQVERSYWYGMQNNEWEVIGTQWVNRINIMSTHNLFISRLCLENRAWGEVARRLWPTVLWHSQLYLSIFWCSVSFWAKLSVTKCSAFSWSWALPSLWVLKAGALHTAIHMESEKAQDSEAYGHISIEISHQIFVGTCTTVGST